MTSVNATPIVAELQPQFVTFRAERKSYCLHNAKKRPVEVMFGGNLFTIPAVNVVGPRDPEIDADGDPIPGTRVIEDIYHFIPEWEEELLILDSTRAVQHILGIKRSSDGRAAEATSRFALGGLSLLPRHPRKDTWQAVARSGSDRAFLIEVDNAQQHIISIDEKNAKRKAAGQEPVHGGMEYDRARMLLAEYGKLTNSAVRDQVRSAAPHEVSDEIDELELEVFVKARVQELVEKASAGRVLDKVALAEQLLQDPSVRLKLQKQYTIRKKGHLPQSEETLNAAAAAGQTLDQIETNASDTGTE